MKYNFTYKLSLFLVIILFFINKNLFAQDPSTLNQTKKPIKVELKGVLASSSDGERLIGAYIYGKDKNTPIAIADSLGVFTVKCYADSVTSLSFSYMGFLPLTRRFIIRKDQNIGIIKMAPDVLNFEEVIVNATPPLAVQRGDTTEFNSAAIKLAADADLENLIKKLPGFELIDGKIMAQGEEVKKIYIDGKKHFLNNPNAVLKNLPASIVSKIKMYDDKSEEAKFSGYDDGTKHRSLNIVTKNPNKMKVFGNANGEYGISQKVDDTFKDNRYGVGIFANMFDLKQRISISGNTSSNSQANTLEQANYKGKGGNNSSNSASVNYSSEFNEKLSFSGNVDFNSGESYSASATIQDYFPSANYQSRIYNSETHSWGENERYSTNLSFEYKLSKRDKISFSPSFSRSTNENRSVNLASTIEDSDTLNTVSSVNRNVSTNTSMNGRLSWMHAFKKKGRTFTTTLTYNQTENKSEQLQNNFERFRNSQNILSDTIRNNKSENVSENLDYTIAASYSEPLSDKSRISANYTFENSYDNSSKESYIYNDEFFNELIGLDTALTNGLGLKNLRHSFGLNYNFSEKDKIRFSFGGNAKLTDMTNEYSFLGVQDSLAKNSYYDLSPRAELNYRLSKSKNVSMTYNGNTSSPRASQLLDILDVSNPLQVSKGNPNLKKGFNHSLSFRYNTSNTEKMTYLSVNVSFSQSFNNISSNMRFINNDTIVNGYELQKGTRLSSPVNLNGGWNANSNASYSLQIPNWKLVLNSNVSYRYSHTPSIYDNISTFSNSHNGTLSLSLSTNVSENFDCSIRTTTSYSHSVNTQTGNSELFNESLSADLRWDIWKGFFVGGNFSYQYYKNKKGNTINQANSLLDLEIGKKFGKRKAFNIKFAATDILRQRNTINHTLSEHYATTSFRTNTDNYYKLSVSYRFMRMGARASMGSGDATQPRIGGRRNMESGGGMRSRMSVGNRH